MGVSRVLSERARQSAESAAHTKALLHTSNHRVEQSHREAQDFAESLKFAEVELANFVKGTRVLCQSTRSFLHSPLPRVWDYPAGVDAATHTGIAMPQGDDEVEVSEALRHQEAHVIAGAQESMEARLQLEVIVPFHQWITRLDLVTADMKILEARRLEVDSRRRSNAKLDKKEAKLAEKASSPREALKADKAHVKTTHKGLKAEEIEVEWMEMENRIFKQLQDLMKDAEEARHRGKLAMRIVSESFAKATEAVALDADGVDGQRAQEQGRLDEASRAAAVAEKPAQVEIVPAGRPVPQPTPGGVEAGAVTVERVYPEIAIREAQST